MAETPNRSLLVEPVTTPQHYERPNERELRSQSIHRLQVGLSGLCAMLLLVSLANIIMDRAQLSEDKDESIEEVIAADAAPKKPASDPLADIGVVPSSEPVQAEPAPQPAPDAQADPPGGQ